MFIIEPTEQEQDEFYNWAYLQEALAIVKREIETDPETRERVRQWLGNVYSRGVVNEVKRLEQRTA